MDIKTAPLLDRFGHYVIVAEECSTSLIHFMFAIYHDDGRRIFRACNMEDAETLLSRLALMSTYGKGRG
jgi:hypothetical protein